MNNLLTSPPKFLQKPSPHFFMVHLLHRLYGIDAPDCLACLLASAFHV